MGKQTWRIIFVLMTLLTISLPSASAQTSELVASLEVLNAGVEVRRVDTLEWVAIGVETLVGQGDSIRTDSTGSALVTFFANGSAVELTPDTEYRIVEFSGSSEQFTLTVEVVAGITRQQFERLLDPGSSYQLITPGAVLSVRGTDFDIRVERSGRSSVLTFDGMVAASDLGEEAEVPAGFGLRSEVEGPLSEVVPATTFEELDIALDGCPGTVTTDADVRLNVRLGPGLDYERVGSIEPSEIDTLMGRTSDVQWYRIRFHGGYGWFSTAGMTVTMSDNCPPIREFDATQSEDAALFGLIGDQNVVVQVTASTANLRSGPGTGYRRVGFAYTGDQLTIIGRNDDTTWLRVFTDDGQTAWIAAFLVDINTDLNQIGVVPVDEIEPEPTIESTNEENGAETTPTPEAE